MTTKRASPDGTLRLRSSSAVAGFGNACKEAKRSISSNGSISCGKASSFRFLGSCDQPQSANCQSRMAALFTKSAIADKAGRWQARPAASSGHDWHVPQAALTLRPLILWLTRLNSWFSMKLCRLGKNLSISSCSLGRRSRIMMESLMLMKIVDAHCAQHEQVIFFDLASFIIHIYPASPVRNTALSALTHLPSKAGTWSYGTIQCSPRLMTTCSRKSRALTSPISLLGCHHVVRYSKLRKHGTTELRVMSTCIDFACTMTP